MEALGPAFTPNPVKVPRTFGTVLSLDSDWVLALASCMLLYVVLLNQLVATWNAIIWLAHSIATFLPEEAGYCPQSLQL